MTTASPAAVAAAASRKATSGQLPPCCSAATKLDKEAPKNRAALEQRRDKDLEKLQAERKKALEKRRKRRAREMEEAVLDATERARREGREACDRLVAEDDSARRLDDEAERLRRLLAEANRRAADALQNKKNRLAALEKDHRRAMAAVVVDHGEEPVQASVRDDLTDARAMAQARRAELVLSDKRAAADEKAAATAKDRCRRHSSRSRTARARRTRTCGQATHLLLSLQPVCVASRPVGRGIITIQRPRIRRSR